MFDLFKYNIKKNVYAKTFAGFFISCYALKDNIKEDFKMSIGQVAGIIAAIAFIILVFWLGWFLTKLINNLNTLTKNIDDLSKELESVIKNTDSLLDDLNEKADTITPAVQAIADVGQSVSDVNEASRNFVDKIKSRKKSGPLSSISRIVLTGVMSRMMSRRKSK